MKKILMSLGMVTLLSLSGCAQDVPQPIQGSNDIGTYYIAQPGDTLARISTMYNVDYQTLAMQNNISYPYTLTPGEKIYVKINPALQNAQANNMPGSSVKPVSAPTQIQAQNVDLSKYGATQGKVYVQPVTVAVPTAVTATTANSIATQLMQQANETPPPSPASKPAPTMISTSTKSINTQITWSWPTNGQITEMFGQDQGLLARGVDISVPNQSEVYATANGTVLFSGIGAPDYGKMVIIKHANNFLTVYSNLSSILVQQNDVISRGQEIGVSGNISGQSLLHFEVRRYGSAVNPLGYLPSPTFAPKTLAQPITDISSSAAPIANTQTSNAVSTVKAVSAAKQAKTPNLASTAVPTKVATPSVTATASPKQLSNTKTQKISTATASTQTTSKAANISINKKATSPTATKSTVTTSTSNVTTASHASKTVDAAKPTTTSTKASNASNRPTTQTNSITKATKKTTIATKPTSAVTTKPTSTSHKKTEPSKSTKKTNNTTSTTKPTSTSAVNNNASTAGSKS